jgi:hypothetical protein
VAVAGKGQPYAHFVHHLYACLSERGTFNAKAPGPRPIVGWVSAVARNPI